MRILRSLESSKQFLFLMLTAFLFFILRLPSLFEPLWYGDEGIYQVVGNSINHGRLLYSQIFDNKPPFLYWLYAILQSDQFSVRLASLIFGLLSIGIFFLLSKKLFKDSKNNNIAYLTTFIFTLLFGLPAIEGNIANAENFMLLPIIASAFLIVSQRKFIIAGLLLGIAFLFKIVAVFDLSAFLIFCFILNLNSLNISSLKKEIKLLPIVAGFFLPIILVSLFFVFNNTFVDFAKATFISNISYVSYGNKIGSLPILLFIKLALLGIFLLYIFTKRKNINHSSLFISIWFAFSLFNAFFSQRPYTHYLLVLIPSLSLMIGLILFDKKYQKIITITFLVTLLIIVKGFGTPSFNKIINYYQNFISYMMGKKTMVSYQGFFDHRTPIDYEIARFIRSKLAINDTVFIWGNNAQLYELLGVVAPTKYVVAYHILNYKDGFISTQTGLSAMKPKFIVIMPNEKPIPFALTNYSTKINIDNVIIYERIF
jgi:hypothetical protein